MNYAILLVVFCLLTILIYFTDKKRDFRSWVKITLLYLLVFVSYNTEHLHIPIGIIIGYFIVLKWSKDASIMKVTLLFALIGYIFSMYILPPVELKHIPYSKELYEQINRFNEVDSIKLFSKEEQLQEKLRVYTDNQVDIDRVMFLTYILSDKAVKIKDRHWLIYSASHDLGIIGSKKSKGSNEVLFYMTFSGSDYIGMFEHDNNKSYLKYVIKGDIKKSKKP
ncbi:hypothetical protein ACDZ29_06065 [Peribacillus sp. RS7]|uniref:hypothetical protein n=1 Tax=Peribacillus sp. RS7 TaxID=3242679 RepID=UPI0035C1F77F